jgi:sugar phosphate isomerase/epimerase
MLIGVTTDILMYQPTTLAEDITELRGYGMNALEVVPKCAEDLQSASDLQPLVAGITHLSVRMPNPAKLGIDAANGDPTQVILDAIQFAAGIGASLFSIPPTFPDLAEVAELAGALQPFQDGCNKAGLTFAVQNSDDEFSPAGNFESLCQLVTTMNCKITLELGHAYHAMPKHTALLVGEHGDWIAAVHASDATEAFSYLPLGTGHVNYPLLMPIFEEKGFSGPFLINIQHNATKDQIENGQFFLESFEF